MLSMAVLDQIRIQGGRRIYTLKLPCIAPQWEIFRTDIIGYGRLKLYLKIYTPKMKPWVRHCTWFPSHDNGYVLPIFWMTLFAHNGLHGTWPRGRSQSDSPYRSSIGARSWCQMWPILEFLGLLSFIKNLRRDKCYSAWRLLKELYHSQLSSLSLGRVDYCEYCVGVRQQM